MSDFSAGPAQEVNATTAGDQDYAVSAALAGGGHVVAWNSTTAAGHVVLAQLFDASGAKSGGEIVLLQGYSAGGIAALADGSFIVSLGQSEYGPSGPTSAVSYARFDAAAHAMAGPVLVDASTDYNNMLSAGQVFATPGGGFALVETSTSHPTPVSSVVSSIREFDAAGNYVGTIGAGEYFMPQLQVQELRSGGFITAAFPYTGPGPSITSWKAVDASGTMTASAQLHGVYGQWDPSLPSVLALPDGRGLVAWRLNDYAHNTSTWQVQWIDSGGHATQGPSTWNYAGGGTPNLTALADGGFLATWLVGSERNDLYAQSFDAAAQPTSGVQHLETLEQGLFAYSAPYSIIATADGGFLLDYQASGDGIDIFEQKFDAVPASSGGPTPVGSDTLSLAGAHAQYTVASGTITGPDGTISLAGVERVHFGDGYALAFDIHGDAGEAYRIYQAAFDRAPDLPGLGFHINDLDHGVPLWLVAQHFIDSPEFQSTYGSTDNTQFITLLYRNVLDRDPDSGGLQFHMNEFAQGETRADILTHFSESPENQANVIGQIGDGMLYIPLG
jgi:hypothetical protein